MARTIEVGWSVWILSPDWNHDARLSEFDTVDQGFSSACSDISCNDRRVFTPFSFTVAVSLVQINAIAIRRTCSRQIHSTSWSKVQCRYGWIDPCRWKVRRGKEISSSSNESFVFLDVRTGNRIMIMLSICWQRYTSNLGWVFSFAGIACRAVFMMIFRLEKRSVGTGANEKRLATVLLGWKSVTCTIVRCSQSTGGRLAFLNQSIALVSSPFRKTRRLPMPKLFSIDTSSSFKAIELVSVEFKMKASKTRRRTWTIIKRMCWGCTIWNSNKTRRDLHSKMF